MLPLVPVTARTDVPAAAPEATETVNVLLPLPAEMVADEKLAVTPVGSPLTDNATAELNPFKLATVRTKDVELPTFTLAPMGFGISVKLWAETVTLNSSARLLFQLLTKRNASTEPSPVVISHPGPAL
jgi:hypothetical protein